MPELSNSKRLQFKATHAAVHVDPNSAADGRAAAMVQSGVTLAAQLGGLSVHPEEIPLLRKSLPKRKGVRQALAVAESMSQTASLGANFRHASKMSGVKRRDIVDLAKALTEVRRQRSVKIRSLQQEISGLHTAALQAAYQKANKNFTTSERVAAAANRKTLSSNAFGRKLKTSPSIRAIAKARPAAALKMLLGQVEAPAPLIPPKPPSLAQSLDWAQVHAQKQYAELSQLQSIDRGLTEVTWLQPPARAGSFIEFTPLEPVGRLFLERVEMTPVGMERGELVHSVPLTANEEVNISHREWSQQSNEFDQVIEDQLDGYSEKGVAEKADISRATSTESKHSTALNVGASLSANFSYVTLSSSFGYNATSDDTQSQKDSRAHSVETTSKAASRSRRDHKTTFKVASAVETEDMAVRKLVNNTSSPVRVDYYQLMRKWKVDLIRYGLRMTYDIVIPSPGRALLGKLRRLKELEDALNLPMAFGLQASSIDRDSWVDLQATWGTLLEPPPPDTLVIDTIKPLQVQDADKKTSDFLTIDVDANYEITGVSFGATYDAKNDPQKPSDPKDSSNSYFNVVGMGPGPSVGWGGYGGSFSELNGRSGTVNITYIFWRIEAGQVQAVVDAKLKATAFTLWQTRCLATLREAAQELDQLNRARLQAEQKQIQDQLADFNSLILRQMEREEIMKGVLRWLFGPEFDLVPLDVQGLLGGPNELDPSKFAGRSAADWQRVIEYGEFIKFIHNAIEWENILYITYPYFWEAPENWNFKLFLNHADPEHRMFLRAGAARVVLTIREGFEDSFTSLMENGALQTLPYANVPNHPYRKISDEIRSFAETNYPGVPPANPATNVRPLLYPEQVSTWADMSFLIELLGRYHDAKGRYPTSAQGLAVLASQLNAGEALPTSDFWGRPFIYQSPGTTGDYDLFSYGADGVADVQPGGRDKNADISANAEGSVIATWFEYTPTSALDVAMTSNLVDMA